MKVTTLSFFRFEGFWNKLWALVQMGLARRPLRSLPGIGFSKLLGIGRGSGFHPAPNFAAYSLLATWDSIEQAREQVFDSAIYRRYHARSAETWTLFLCSARSRGSWDRQAPFAVEATLGPSEPVGILTRASIDWRRLLRFWRSVPRVSASSFASPAIRFNVGMGELPVVQLMTFSLWDDFASAKTFAYGVGNHKETMLRARSEGWFAEELFVRFRILGAEGTWHGVDPLKECLRTTREFHA